MSREFCRAIKIDFIVIRIGTGVGFLDLLLGSRPFALVLFSRVETKRVRATIEDRDTRLYKLHSPGERGVSRLFYVRMIPAII